MAVSDKFVELSFFITEEPQAPSRESVRSMVNAASSAIAWSLEPLKFVDEAEVIEAQPAESDEALERRRRATSIVSEGAGNVFWPLGAPTSQHPTPIERRAPVPSVKRRLVGGRVLLHDQRRPADPVPLEVDRREYLSVAELVECLAKYAREHGCSWTVLFGGEEIGEVTPDGPDDGVADGLLGEWKRTLLEREAQ